MPTDPKEDAERLLKERQPAASALPSVDLEALLAEAVDAWDGKGPPVVFSDWLARARAALTRRSAPTGRLQEAGALRAAKDTAYAERNQCVALIAKMALALGWRAGVRDHEDKPGETWEPDWRNLVCIDLPTGQVTWHFHDSERLLLTGMPVYPASWDGHDTAEKYRRVNDWLPAAAPPSAPQEGLFKEGLEACPACGEPLCDVFPLASDHGLIATGGLALIAAERKRQIEEEGWTPEHDARHDEGALATAAACYALPPPVRPLNRAPGFWPWASAWWKPGDRLRELAKAGALIAAEIDRLHRALPLPEKPAAPPPSAEKPAGDTKEDK